MNRFDDIEYPEIMGKSWYKDGKILTDEQKKIIYGIEDKDARDAKYREFVKSNQTDEFKEFLKKRQYAHGVSNVQFKDGKLTIVEDVEDNF